MIFQLLNDSLVPLIQQKRLLCEQYQASRFSQGKNSKSGNISFSAVYMDS